MILSDYILHLMDAEAKGYGDWEIVGAMLHGQEKILIEQSTSHEKTISIFVMDPPPDHLPLAPRLIEVPKS